MVVAPPQGDLRRQRAEAMKFIQHRDMSKRSIDELPWSTGLLDIWKDPELLSMSATGNPACLLPDSLLFGGAYAKADGVFCRRNLRCVLHYIPSSKDLRRCPKRLWRMEALHRPQAGSGRSWY